MYSTGAGRHVLVVLGLLAIGVIACGSTDPSGGTGGAAPGDGCQPGSTTSCYSGPTGTQGVGACKSGLATCAADGRGYGPCADEIVPRRELCNGGVDDDCDGTPEPADCVACEPGTGSCNGTIGTSCPDGLHLVTAECDPLQGMTCNPTTGVCDGACSSASLGNGSLGCDFYPTVTANLAQAEARFGVVVTNDSDEPVVIALSKGSEVFWSRTIPASAIHSIELPWVSALRGPTSEAPAGMPASVRVDQGSYRLRSTRPVTVHQFNSFGGHTSSGSSLLLPVNAWADRYRVVARQHWDAFSGFYAITASQDGTTVQVAAPPGGVLVKSGITGIATTGNGSVTLNRGDVVQVVTATRAANDGPSDPTGTLVTADKPIQVIGGHQCANVPAEVRSCDHLEETVPPLSAAASRYIVIGTNTHDDAIPDYVVRILATEPDTHLSYEPAQPNAPSSIALAGASVEFRTSKEIEIRADRPVLVAQYQVGGAGRGISVRDGDPSLVFALPVERYKPNWVVQTPAGMGTSVINMIAPLGTIVQLDGQLVESLKPIGQSGFGVARKFIFGGAGDLHHLSANGPIYADVYVYEYGASHWYPVELPSTK